MHLSRSLELVIAVVCGFIFASLLCVTIMRLEACERSAAAEEGDFPAAVSRARVALAIKTLQPAASEERAAELAAHFVAAATAPRVDLDPLLLVAISFRESSFRSEVERLEVLGTSRRERGLLQNHGVAIRFRPEGCPATLEGAACQVGTGARFLAFCRDTCPGSTWRWVAYYGRSKCPSEHEARADRNAAIAASHYARIGGTNWK